MRRMPVRKEIVWEVRADVESGRVILTTDCCQESNQDGVKLWMRRIKKPSRLLSHGYRAQNR